MRLLAITSQTYVALEGFASVTIVRQRLLFSMLKTPKSDMAASEKYVKLENRKPCQRGELIFFDLLRYLKIQQERSFIKQQATKL